MRMVARPLLELGRVPVVVVVLTLPARAEILVRLPPLPFLLGMDLSAGEGLGLSVALGQERLRFSTPRGLLHWYFVVVIILDEHFHCGRPCLSRETAYPLPVQRVQVLVNQEELVLRRCTDRQPSTERKDQAVVPLPIGAAPDRPMLLRPTLLQAPLARVLCAAKAIKDRLRAEPTHLLLVIAHFV